MPESELNIVRYKCGKVAIVRNDKPITREQQKRCFGYNKGKCSALEELMCKNGGKCSFWKEKTSGNEITHN